MIANLGLTALALAFLSALYAAIVAPLASGYRRRKGEQEIELKFSGPRRFFATAFIRFLTQERPERPEWLESARHAALVTWPLLTLASLALIVLLVIHHFEIAYVANVTSRAMPMYLRVTAWWGGQAGSLLFWCWLMSSFAGAAMLRRWERDRDLMPFVITATMVTLAFFIALVVFVENPFARLWQTSTGSVVEALFQPAGATPYIPFDGRGLNPLLRHPGMIIHPPMLYTGFVSFVIPFAFAFAALARGHTDAEWIKTTRRWTLVAWLFLSMGLVLGGRWAYDVLGWGGYWGWDPVEIAAFMPWLTGTAFLHSVMIQEKRGLLKRWNMLLIIATYDLVIFGTFLTRSGVLSSVHAFAQSAIGPLFFGFIALTFGVSVGLLLWRWDSLKDENEIESWMSREAAFLLNNVLFLAIAVTCFYGVIAPLISELLTGTKITLGPAFYEGATGPMFAGLVLLMGIAPLMAWRKASAKALGRLLWIPAALAVMVVIGVVTFNIIPLQGLLTFNSIPASANSYSVVPLEGGAAWGALLGFFLVALTGVTTLLEFWRGALARVRKGVGENFFTALLHLIDRNRRRYGGYIIHLGVLFMAIGIIGIELFQKETQGTLKLGEQLALGPYLMRYDDLHQWDTDDGRQVTRSTVSVFRDGKLVAELHPREDYYYVSQQPMSIAGLFPSLNRDVHDWPAFIRAISEADFYILLVGWEPIGTDGATFKVYYNPLVNWLWGGTLIFIMGTLVAAWPETAAEKRRAMVPSPASAPSGAD
jgi:cytochrome c-type biogenesis protein CcmF